MMRYQEQMERMGRTGKYDGDDESGGTVRYHMIQANRVGTSTAAQKFEAHLSRVYYGRVGWDL